MEILEVVREEIVETPEEVRGPQVADKEDEVELRVEGKDLVEIPEEVREEIVEILEKVRVPLAADKEVLSPEAEVETVETLELEEEAAVVRDWKQELGKS